MALYDSIIYTVPIAFIYYGLKRGQKMEWILIDWEAHLFQRYTHAQFLLKSTELLYI